MRDDIKFGVGAIGEGRTEDWVMDRSVGRFTSGLRLRRICAIPTLAFPTCAIRISSPLKSGGRGGPTWKVRQPCPRPTSNRVRARSHAPPRYPLGDHHTYHQCTLFCAYPRITPLACHLHIHSRVGHQVATSPPFLPPPRSHTSPLSQPFAEVPNPEHRRAPAETGVI